MEDEYKSKTQRKKEAHDLQALGLKLAELSRQDLERMDIPGPLKRALIEGKSITSNVAARRHRQYIGVLMRDVDPDLIHSSLARLDAPPAKPAGDSSLKLRIQRLLDNEAAETETLLDQCPELERQHLRQLIRNIRKEKPGAKPSKSRKTLAQLLEKNLNSP